MALDPKPTHVNVCTNTQWNFTANSNKTVIAAAANTKLLTLSLTATNTTLTTIRAYVGTSSAGAIVWGARIAINSQWSSQTVTLDQGGLNIATGLFCIVTGSGTVNAFNRVEADG